MCKNLSIVFACFLMVSMGLTYAGVVVEPSQATIPCFDVYEIVVLSKPPPSGNPFTNVKVQVTFTPQNGPPVKVEGFCDDQKGSIFRVRFCPSLADTEYTFSLNTNISDEKFTGSFQTTKPKAMEPVVVDPERV